MKEHGKGFSASKILLPQGEAPSWERFFQRRPLLLLLLLLAAGAAAGSAAAVFGELFQGRWLFPLRFSGIPPLGSGYASCFTTLLFHALIGLSVLFLLGITAFGIAAVPAFLFFQGFAVGVGASSFLWEGALKEFCWSALVYTPAAAATGTLFLLFGVRALVFSHRLAKAGFSSQERRLDLKVYFQDFLLFLSLAAGVSLLASLPAAVFGLFL